MTADEYEVMARVEDDHFWFVATRAMVRDSVESCGLGREALVVDIGCGTGGTMKAIGALDLRLLGVDNSPSAVKFASSRTGRPVLCASACNLPLRSGTVDLCLMLDVLEHIGDHESAVAEVARTLKPGAHLVLTVPCHPWLFSTHDRALGHKRRYSKKGVLALLRLSGLEPVRITYTNSFLFPAVAVYRLLRKALSARKNRVRSDAALAVGPLNGFLKAVMLAERSLLRRIDMPWGLGLLVVSRKVG